MYIIYTLLDAVTLSLSRGRKSEEKRREIVEESEKKNKTKKNKVAQV